jgi:hypothetical protein
MAIVNRKNISTAGVDADALTPTTSDEKVLINFGDLTTTGSLANGIFAGANDVLIQNFRVIETSGLGAAGIYVQGENAHIENHGSVITTGDFFGDFSAEGIFAEGDRFYIANHGSVHVEGVTSSALIGVGADGLVINFNVVNSLATFSAVIAAFGERSQAINAGQVTSGVNFNQVMAVDGEDASAVNRGEVLVTGAGSTGMAGTANTHLTNQGVISITFTAEDSFGFGMVGLGGGTQISNFGLIETQGTYALGITALGRVSLGELGLDFEIVNAGRIATEGDLAIGVALGLGRSGFANAAAADGQIENRGVIETAGDGAAGAVMVGNGHHLTNSGQITTNGGEFDSALLGESFRAAGVVVSGDDALVENTRTGVIESMNMGSAAVELNVLERPGLPAAAMSSTLENFGLIKGADVAVLGGAGKETVINHSSIVGDVDLGEGDDTFVFGKGGVLDGDLVLGGGDDTVVIEDGSGTSRIQDFVAGDAATDDVIDVSAFFFSSFDDLIANSTDSGEGVVIALDPNDVLVLVGVSKTDLHGDDFSFV